ncbi:TonB-dependent receptor [uncultured Alistipes sp.]|jgi:hypothetical protein|uniref:TonB-dependent receptor n=1 Tax=uncultured Alistipes sp. TaxID=538949 RepID=UPI0025CF06F6|nr:TonB-dependent receptor [uncultured Alistipes sp.]
MKRILFIAALFAALPWSADAQVEKQVEVTKAYVPSVENASKLAIVPDMTDTVRMRPEIDYTITPLSMRTTLATRPIRPASVTYWEFNRPLPFYVKAGMGYPLNSVLDFYASSQNPGTGYVVGYVNHEGRYAKIKNDFDIKNKSTRMLNRVGVSAGKYFGRHTLEGDISYENRMYHRYGMYVAPDVTFNPEPGSMADFSDANVAVRFGDDFKDLSRVNFEVAIRGGLFFDHSEWPDYNDKARQSTLEAHAKIARGFGRHRFAVELGYERLAGQKAIDLYNQQFIHAALRYGIDGGVVRLEAGADYYHDKVKGIDAENYILPFAHILFDLGAAGFKPFIEVDGRVRENSYRSLSLQNPYIFTPNYLSKSSVDYNSRLGITGSLWKGKFDYRLYAGFSIRDNHIYWYSYDDYDQDAQTWNHAALMLSPAVGRQTVFSFNGEVTWRPCSSFRTELGAALYSYSNEKVKYLNTKLHNGEPSFKGNLSAHYDGRKISFGAGVHLQSVRKWSCCMTGDSATGLYEYDAFEAPFAADLRVNFDWKVSGRVTLFAEGRNLLDRKLYEYPWYRDYGVNFTVGVKANF